MLARYAAVPDLPCWARWGARCRQIVKQIDLWGVDMLFVVGGNGGNAGAAAIQVCVAQRRWKQ